MERVVRESFSIQSRSAGNRSSTFSAGSTPTDTHGSPWRMQCVGHPVLPQCFSRRWNIPAGCCRVRAARRGCAAVLLRKKIVGAPARVWETQTKAVRTFDGASSVAHPPLRPRMHGLSPQVHPSSPHGEQRCGKRDEGCRLPDDRPCCQAERPPEMHAQSPREVAWSKSGSTNGKVLQQRSIGSS